MLCLSTSAPVLVVLVCEPVQLATAIGRTGSGYELPFLTAVACCVLD